MSDICPDCQTNMCDLRHVRGGRLCKQKQQDTAEPAEGDRWSQLQDKNKRLQQWVHDLQSGMYINCMYCGHRYGPKDEVPASMADVLKEHIEQCPKHPMSALKSQIDKLANFIMAEVPDEPSKSEGAVECAIRFIKDFQRDLKNLKPLIERLESSSYYATLRLTDEYRNAKRILR